MVQIHNLGFPRIGTGRELKFAQEAYWKGNSDSSSLLAQAQSLREQNWQDQAPLDWVPVGDFSLYDHVLDTSFLFGNLPERAANCEGSELDQYFRLARGRSAGDSDAECIQAAEMTKWFDTNYHYLVPELDDATTFSLNPARFLDQLQEAKALGVATKPVLIGPLTYLWLSKTRGEKQPLDYLQSLVAQYSKFLDVLGRYQVEWVQIDEPILVTELSPEWQGAFEKAYDLLQQNDVKVLVASYFGPLKDNLKLACQLPVAGLHIDVVNGRDEVEKALDWLPSDSVLSLGVINGRNIWKTDLNATVDWLEPIAKQREDRLWLAPSCSLLHVPIDLESEKTLDADIYSWLAFARQKLDELQVLRSALNGGRHSVQGELDMNAEAIQHRKASTRIHNVEVKKAVAEICSDHANRSSPYDTRRGLHVQRLQLPAFPTTTIGSFPQTSEIRKARLRFKMGQLDQNAYQALIKTEITGCIREQEQLGLDVFVHGEAERNDMVEYFGEQLEGYAISQFGWVQSYGSRCVKPPILYGDIQRPSAITVDWIGFAQSLTHKPVKGMLTGPITILNWSFVRDDQPRSDTSLQLALAIRQEVLDLENAGVAIIQIDEAALREGLPLRRSDWQAYLDWATFAFRLCANGVQDGTQIHTHMCYSEFNDIIQAIASLDADVITIESSRSNMALLDVFESFDYPNEIGPGVFDIHSPNIPDIEHMVRLIQKASERIPRERLWINPDCGLKTRQWQEVIPALQNMVEAAQRLRVADLAA